MSAWRIARIGVGVLAVVVLTVSGAYMLLYLYRWEWNRAVISGLFFLSALVTISTAMILGALRRLSTRLDHIETATSEAAVGATLRSSNAEHARRHFAWLEDQASHTSVFIPVLLGAGMLLTGISYLLERLAGMVAGASIDRRTARLLALDLPLGPPGEHPVPPPPRPSGLDPLGLTAPPSRPRSGRVLGLAVSALVVALALTGGVTVLREATESRPEPGTYAGATAVVLDIDQRRVGRPVPEVAEALWIACRGRLRPGVDLTRVTALGGGRVEIELDQGMGPLRQRRLFGCLQDATLDLARARVVSARHLP